MRFGFEYWKEYRFVPAWNECRVAVYSLIDEDLTFAVALLEQQILCSFSSTRSAAGIQIYSTDMHRLMNTMIILYM